MGRFRRRYSLFVSGGYILAGAIMGVRSILAGVEPVALLGAVFIALGVVRLRDLFGWRSRRDR